MRPLIAFDHRVNYNRRYRSFLSAHTCARAPAHGRKRRWDNTGPAFWSQQTDARRVDGSPAMGLPVVLRCRNGRGKRCLVLEAHGHG